MWTFTRFAPSELGPVGARATRQRKQPAEQIVVQKSAPGSSRVFFFLATFFRRARSPTPGSYPARADRRRLRGSIPEERGSKGPNAGQLPGAWRSGRVATRLDPGTGRAQGQGLAGKKIDGRSAPGSCPAKPHCRRKRDKSERRVLTRRGDGGSRIVSRREADGAPKSQRRVATRRGGFGRSTATRKEHPSPGRGDEVPTPGSFPAGQAG